VRQLEQPAAEGGDGRLGGEGHFFSLVFCLFPFFLSVAIPKSSCRFDVLVRVSPELNHGLEC
jgi:hypothetical protein